MKNDFVNGTNRAQNPRSTLTDPHQRPHLTASPVVVPLTCPTGVLHAGMPVSVQHDLKRASSLQTSDSFPESRRIALFASTCRALRFIWR
jgi:hypothetical protein